jgi:hypothetical protein
MNAARLAALLPFVAGALSAQSGTPARAGADVETGPGVSACAAAGFSNPKDASTTNLRAAPRTGAKVIGHFPGLAQGTDLAEPEFDIVGSKDGWLLIRNARSADPAAESRRVLFAGPGWIWGGLAGVQLADYSLRSAPRTDAPVVAWLQNVAKGWGPDSFGVRTIHACQGQFVEVTAAPPGGKEIRGWVARSCRNQLTTCDVGGMPPPPSFDCAAARTRPEQMICADASLASLDRSLSDEFTATLEVAPRQAALRADQRQWLMDTRDKAPDADTLRQAYEHRQAALHQAADEARAVRTATDTVDLKGKCAALRHEPDETCRVEEAGAMGGGFWYQLQGYFAGELRVYGGVAVFADTGSRRVPAVWDTGDTAHFGKPEWVVSPYGKLLELRGSIEGTGNFPAGSLYREVEGRWSEIEAATWLSDLAGRLPKGRAVRKGVYPDWAKMTADTPLWRDGDGECCPSGGSVHATLVLRGDRIALGGVQVSDKPIQ